MGESLHCKIAVRNSHSLFAKDLCATVFLWRAAKNNRAQHHQECTSAIPNAPANVIEYIENTRICNVLVQYIIRIDFILFQLFQFIHFFCEPPHYSKFSIWKIKEEYQYPYTRSISVNIVSAMRTSNCMLYVPGDWRLTEFVELTSNM